MYMFIHISSMCLYIFECDILQIKMSVPVDFIKLLISPNEVWKRCFTLF